MSEKSESFVLRRRAVVAAILDGRGDTLVVAGLGSAAWDVTAAGVDLTAIARGCGFALGRKVRSEPELAAAIPEIRSAPGPAFFTVKVRAEKLPLVLPPKDGTVLKNRFRRVLLGEAAG